MADYAANYAILEALVYFMENMRSFVCNTVCNKNWHLCTETSNLSLTQKIGEFGPHRKEGLF